MSLYVPKTFRITMSFTSGGRFAMRILRKPIPAMTTCTWEISPLSCLKSYIPFVLLKTRCMRISFTNFIYTLRRGPSICIILTSSSSSCSESWIHSSIRNAVIFGLCWSKIHTMVLRRSDIIMRSCRSRDCIKTNTKEKSHTVHKNTRKNNKTRL